MDRQKKKIHADGILFAAGGCLLVAFFVTEFLTRARTDLLPHPLFKMLEQSEGILPDYVLRLLERTTQTSPRPILLILFLILLCMELYLAALLRVRRTGDERIFSRCMQVFFLLYLYLLLTFTLSDDHFGRADMNMTREEYLASRVNYIPFATVKLYIRAFLNGYVVVRLTILNLIGNICAFMPFAFFLPRFFRLQRKWYVFLPTILLCVSAIEGIQFAFMVGSCDVDDLILNAGGAFLLYLIFLIPPVKRFCDKIYTGDWKRKKHTHHEETPL